MPPSTDRVADGSAPLRPVTPTAPSPGSMTQAMRAARAPRAEGPRWLRVGVLGPDQKIEERRFSPAQGLVVGRTERADLVLGGEGVPSRHLLFEHTEEGWALRFTEAMEGKIRLEEGEALPLSSLRIRAEREGDQWILPLGEQARGRVEVGQNALLFQLVDRPPARPSPGLGRALPSAQGGLLGQIDWLFTAFVACSILAHLGFVIFLAEADWPLPPGIGTVDERVASLIFEAPEEPVEAPVEERSEPSDEAEEVAEPSETSRETVARNDRPAPHRPPAPTHNDSPSIDSEAIAAEAAMGVQQMLGAIGADGHMANLLREGAMETSQEEVMASVRTAGIVSRDPGILRERDRELPGPNPGFGHNTEIDGSNHEVEEGSPIDERTILVRNPDPGRVIPEGPGEGFDPRELVAAIRLRVRAIRSCYERELRDDPQLSGRLALSITVRETGTLSPVQSVENTVGPERLESCVEGVIRRIRIRNPPTDGHVTVEYPFIFDRTN